jgi:hypothetical protein
VTTRTEELLAEGVITRLDVMVQETSATVAGLNPLSRIRPPKLDFGLNCCGVDL